VPQVLIVDIQRIKQVFLNLLQNAYKFTFRGGISVTISYDSLTKMLTGRVADTGIGIKEDDQARLFEIFGKLKSTA
jgi:signal transduction histidine kinase